jgi:hypothetical protein
MQTGFSSHVEALQTALGIKDAFAKPWIDQLLMKASVLQRKRPGILPSNMESELCDWLDAQPGLKRNPLLDVPGI